MVTLATEPNEKRFRIGAITLTLVAVAWLPLLVVYATHLWALPHYQYFPMVIVGAALLARRRLASGVESEPGSRQLSLLLSIPPMGMLLVAILLNSPWLGAVSFLLMLLALIYRAGGWTLVRRLLPAWVLLWLAISLPMRWDTILILSLQRITAQMSGEILDLIGVVHRVSGTIVQIPGKQLLVEEACSGVHSLFSATAFTVFMLLWWRSPWIRSILLLVTLPVWVIVANVARVVSVTLLLVVYEIQADKGVLHETIGFAAFALAVLLILSANCALRYITGGYGKHETNPEGETASAEEHESSENPDARQKFQLPWKSWLGTLASPAMCVATALFATVQVAVLVNASRLEAAPTLREPIAGIVAETLPGTWEDWKQTGFRTEQRGTDSNFGPVSQSWDYACGDSLITASIDYPFLEWHELSACYANQGWHVQQRGATRVSGFGKNEAEVVNLQLRSPHGDEYGDVAFSLCRSTGAPADPPGFNPWRDAWNRLFRGQATSLLAWLREKHSPRQTVQLQVFRRGFRELNDKEREQSGRFLKVMYDQLLPYWTASKRQPLPQEKQGS